MKVIVTSLVKRLGVFDGRETWSCLNISLIVVRSECTHTHTHTHTHRAWQIHGIDCVENVLKACLKETPTILQYTGSEGKAPRILNFGASRTRSDVSNLSVSALLLTVYFYRGTFSVR